MNNQKELIATEYRSYRKSICFVFFLYWFVLVVWQNIGGAELRSAADTIIKLVLLLYLCWSFFSRSRVVSQNSLVIILLFAGTQLITLFTRETISFYILVTYCFTILFVFMTYGVGRHFEITQRELIQLFYCIIAVVLYTVLYTVIAEPEQYRNAFTSTTGYGSEFHAFFASNHEFAMYCFFGTAAAVLLVDMDHRLGGFGRVLLLAIATVFLLHIVLSFSRVTMICAVGFLLTYVILNKRSLCKKWVYLLVILGIIAYLLSEPLQTFLYEVAFKAGNVSSREILMEKALAYYRGGSLFQQLFGFGITESRAHITEEATFGSVHNGYMQVLLYYGVTGLLWMAAILISQLVAGIKFLRKDKLIAAISIALTLVAAANMVTSTQLIFTSPIDCFFITAMFIVVPKYMRNAADNNRFYQKTDG